MYLNHWNFFDGSLIIRVAGVRENMQSRSFVMISTQHPLCHYSLAPYKSGVLRIVLIHPREKDSNNRIYYATSTDRRKFFGNRVS